MASYLITGCSRGLGLALAHCLSSFPKSEVSIIFVTSRKGSAALIELIDRHSGRVDFVSLDVLSEVSIKAAVNSVEQRLSSSGLDVLVNNVGIMGTAPGGAPAMYFFHVEKWRKKILMSSAGMISNLISKRTSLHPIE